MNNYRQKAIEVLKNGGIVIFPTDTAYGIGCRIDDESAIKRLFKIRKRPETKATPVLVSGMEMAKKFWKKIPDAVTEKLIKHYWPGALTIVLPCKTDIIPGLVRGGGDTLGLRMPAREDLLEMIREVGVPIIGTSANFAGDKTPYKFSDLDPELVKLVDFVIKGESGIGQASTVIDCSVEPWKILRQGAVKLSI